MYGVYRVDLEVIMDIQKIGNSVRELGSVGLKDSEWWDRYNQFVVRIDEGIEECLVDSERISWMRLKKDVLELGARVSGMLKAADGGVQIDKVLIVVSDRANSLLERCR